MGIQVYPEPVAASGGVWPPYIEDWTQDFRGDSRQFDSPFIAAVGLSVTKGDGNHIYVLPGGGTAFWRWNRVTGIWTEMTPLPVTTGTTSNSAMVWAGGDFIYAQVNASTALYRYSIVGNSWTTMTVSPNAAGAAVQLRYPGTGDFIYQLVGGSAIFNRYSISGNSWTAMTWAPFTISYPQSAWHGTDDLYVAGSNGSTTWARYRVSTNAWTTALAALPFVAASVGGFMTVANDKVYYLPPNTTTGARKLQEYNIGSNTWATSTWPSLPHSHLFATDVAVVADRTYVFMATTERTVFYYDFTLSRLRTIGPRSPSLTSVTTTMAVAAGKLYVIWGGSSVAWWTYEISTGTWEALPDLPWTGSYMDLVAVAGGIYVRSGTNFSKYTISDRSFSTLAVATTATSSGRRMAWDGGDYIYAVTGGVTEFQRYSIVNNTWTTLAALPFTPGTLSWFGYHPPYAWCLSFANNLYRYSPGPNTWSAALDPVPLPPTGSFNLLGLTGAGGEGLLVPGNPQLRYDISLNKWSTTPWTWAPLETPVWATTTVAAFEPTTEREWVLDTVATPSSGSSAQGTTSVTLPGGIAAGDIITVFYCSYTVVGVPVLPAGYTLLAGATGTGTNSCYVRAAYRVATGNEGGSSVKFTPDDSSYGIHFAYIIKNSAGTVPNAAGAAGSGSNSTGITAPAITTTQVATELLFFGTMAGSSGPPVLGTLAGFTLVESLQRTQYSAAALYRATDLAGVAAGVLPARTITTTLLGGTAGAHVGIGTTGLPAVVSSSPVPRIPWYSTAIVDTPFLPADQPHRR